MTEYKPTYQDRCEDPNCQGYGKPLVDRGYGYPVCVTASECIGPHRKAMNPVFLEQR